MPASLRLVLLQSSWAQAFTWCLGLLYAAFMLQLLPALKPLPSLLVVSAALLVLVKECLEAPVNGARALACLRQSRGWTRGLQALLAGTPPEIQGWGRTLLVWLGLRSTAQLMPPAPAPLGAEVQVFGMRRKTAYDQLLTLWLVGSVGDTLVAIVALHLLPMSTGAALAAHMGLALVHVLACLAIVHDRRSMRTAQAWLTPTSLQVDLGVRGWADVPLSAIQHLAHARHGLLRPESWNRQDVMLSLMGGANLCITLRPGQAQVLRLGAAREDAARLWLRVDDPEALARALRERMEALP